MSALRRFDSTDFRLRGSFRGRTAAAVAVLYSREVCTQGLGVDALTYDCVVLPPVVLDLGERQLFAPLVALANGRIVYESGRLKSTAALHSLLDRRLHRT